MNEQELKAILASGKKIEIRMPEVTPAEWESLGLCPKCLRPVPPKDCEDLHTWLIRNDPMYYRAYYMGVIDERNRIESATRPQPPDHRD